MAIIKLTGFRSHKTPTETAFDFDIALLQHTRGRKRFQVKYGAQLDVDLGYGEAAAKLGEAILHALACAGEIDNEVA